MRCSNGVRPAGKPVETAATGMPEPSSASTAVGDEGVVDAHGADPDRQLVDAQRLEQIARGPAGAPWRRAGAPGRAYRRRRAS